VNPPPWQPALAAANVRLTPVIVRRIAAPPKRNKAAIDRNRAINREFFCIRDDTKPRSRFALPEAGRSDI
jgi:hypothetical protein